MCDALYAVISFQTTVHSPPHPLIISVLNLNMQLRNRSYLVCPDYHLHLQATLSLLHAHEKPGLDDLARA